MEWQRLRSVEVRPYKPVIPHHIYEEVMEFYMKDTLPKTSTFPPRCGKCQIESKIIKPRLAYVIANWIEKKDGKTARNKLSLKYKFDLVFRGSRDGINTFNNYSGQAKYLVLVKDQSSKIYGGYSPIGFRSYLGGNRWQNTPDSFIFSCENDRDINNMKISRVISPNYAILENYSQGFNFGNTFYLSGQNVYLQYQGYYDNNAINTNTNFIPKEIELFNVVSS
ncbi:3222_t:CDS:2 [Funneliformis geosporum]|uniref:3222_t:CDS:1 n=1 Tax=Funneliformis geosporum TaxID=1117311 RepID=A0A9W4WSN0_9GLOM|nr:3222_t:CDS:2 [Funneliformis geosporum]